MYDISAHAIRHHGSIEVTILGLLPSSCHQAVIADIYPGGHIVYIKDPGVAQVFIEETLRPGTMLCAMVLVPWAGTVTIIDDFHDKVSIYVNRQKQLDVTVKEKSKGKFIVLQLTGGIIPNGGYSIVPANTIYPAIYTKVYGPASYAKCDEWVKQHSEFSILDGLALGFGVANEANEKEEVSGGGSEAPRGLAGLLKTGGANNPRAL